MAKFYNQATLNYNGKTIASNIVSGELLGTVKAEKTALIPSYTTNDEVTYVVNIVNSLDNDITNAVMEDNLGVYELGSLNPVPLNYVAESLKYYVNGELGDGAAISAEDNKLTVTGFTIPANGDVVIVYQVTTNQYAPMAAGSEINNKVKITGTGLSEAVQAEETIYVIEEPVLAMVKAMSPTVVYPGDTLTYTFTITNNGNQEAVGVVISDEFKPVLENITVTYNDQTWAEGVDYSYSGGMFNTELKPIDIPAATFAQDTTTGEITTIPGIAVIKVTGKVSD